MQPVSSVNVFCADGHTCKFDPITPLYTQCGEIIIPVGTQPHQVKVNPTAITIIPTAPTPYTQRAYTDGDNHGNGKGGGYGYGYGSGHDNSKGNGYGYGNGYGNGHGYGKGHGHGYGGSKPAPPAYCKNPLIDIAIDLLGLDIDIAAYLDLSGLLDAVGDILGGVLGGGKGKGKGKGRRPSKIPRRYEAHCGSTLKHGHSGTQRNYTTASDATDCVRKCEDAGILATVKLGSLVDCLGITIDHGVSVDNCLFVLGDKDHILDLDLDLLGGDSATDSLINLKLK